MGVGVGEGEAEARKEEEAENLKNIKQHSTECVDLRSLLVHESNWIVFLQGSLHCCSLRPCDLSSCYTTQKLIFKIFQNCLLFDTFQIRTTSSRNAYSFLAADNKTQDELRKCTTFFFLLLFCTAYIRLSND